MDQEMERKGTAENLPELFTIHERGFQPKTIDIPGVFGNDPEQTVAFEVALVATIATAVLSMSIDSPALNRLGTAVALILLSLTVIRKMALDNHFHDTTAKMNRSTGYLLHLTVFSAIYVTIAAAEWVGGLIGINVLVLLGIIMLLLSLSIVLAYEVVFGDYFLWAAAQVHNSAISNGSGILVALAARLPEYSPHSFNPEHPAVAPLAGTSSEAQEHKSRLAQLLVFVVLFGLVAVVGVVVGTVIFVVRGRPVAHATLLAAFLFLGVMPLQGQVQFLLARYGNASFDAISGLGVSVRSGLVLFGVVVLYQFQRTGSYVW